VQANIFLLLAAALWGFGNVAQKTVLEHLDPLSAVGLRCLIGGLLLLPMMLSERHPGGSRYLVSTLRVSAPFALGLIFQQVAYLDTSVTNASFLINLATVITPAVAWLMLGERPSLVIALSGSLALTGALLLSGGISLTMSPGDLAACVAAACFALWMVELSRHTRLYGNPMTAACVPFIITAMVTLPFIAAQDNLTLHAMTDALPDLIVLAVFSTAIAFALLTRAQRYTSSSHAAVIVCAESIFGAAGGAIVLGERVSHLQGVGCAIVLSAVILQALYGAQTTRAPNDVPQTALL